MAKKFSTTRIFFDNVAIGRNDFYIEFVFDNTLIRKVLNALDGDSRIRRSKSQEKECVYVPTNYKDFIKALKATRITRSSVVERYDEACLLMQPLNGRPGIRYLKDDDTLSLTELVSFAAIKLADSSLSPQERQTQKTKFIEECKDIIITALAHERYGNESGR